MKPQRMAIAAALVASLIGGGYGIAQAQTNTTTQTTAACTGGEHIMLRADTTAPADAEVSCTAPQGAQQEGLPATEQVQPAPAEGQAEIAAAPEAVGVSKAPQALESHGQVEPAGAPGNAGIDADSK